LNQPALSAFIWTVADLLRGDYKQSDYGKVILPLTVLRRLDCILAPTKDAVLAEKQAKEALGMNPAPFLIKKAGQPFYNTSPLDLKKLMGDQDNIAANLFSYVQAFSSDVRDIFERFELAAQVDRLGKSGLLYQVIEKFTQVDLHPDRVDNHQMGLPTNQHWECPYFRVKFDMSHVSWVMTSNDVARVPVPLRNRCTVIELPALNMKELANFTQHEVARRGLSEQSAEAIVATLSHPISRHGYFSLRDVVRMIDRAEVLETKPRLH
jgi:hypothetical protein